MKNILLLTDFSETSKNAIHYALQLFENKETTFHLVYVHKASAFTSADLMTSSTDNLYASIVKSPQEDLEDLVNSLKTSYKNDKHTINSHVDYDVFTDAINQLIQLQNIDLIVMGTNGVTGADEVVFGSHTLNVIRKVKCPTLVIPKDFKFETPNEVLIPLDEKDHLNKSRLSLISSLLHNKATKFHILRVIETENDSFKEADVEVLNSNFSEENYSYFNITNVPLHYVVDTYVQTNTIDFEVFIIQQTTFFERLFKGSPITKHSKVAKVPLFILHD